MNISDKPQTFEYEIDLPTCALAEVDTYSVVNEEALGVDAILEIGWDSTGYMMHKHTREHMRETWQSIVFDPGAPLSPTSDPGSEHHLLARARELWRENLKGYEPPNHSDDFLRALRAICDRAGKELASLS